MTISFAVHLPTGEIEQIVSLDQPDELVVDCFARSNRYAPDVLTIEILPDYKLKLGLADESFVKICKTSPDSPCMTSLGDTNRLGTRTFFITQKHPINLQTRNLIPFSIARRVMNRFVTDYEFSEEIKWEKLEVE
jgi:hypothetical protein